MGLPNCILFDVPAIKRRLLPLTFTRPVADLRVGISTIAEKWDFYCSHTPSFFTEAYLQPMFPIQVEQDNILINGNLLPNEEVLSALAALPSGTGLLYRDELIALRATHSEALAFAQNAFVPTQTKNYHGTITRVFDPWDIFRLNGAQIREDFARITSGRTSEGIGDAHTVVYGKEHVFVEEGVQVWNATIQATQGPVYLGRNSEVQEGSLIRGPFALGEHAVLNMGAKMRSDTTIGPWCKVGGEVSNSVLHSYSNKAHDGFLGNSVLGSWCNLGADTNSSNLKNTYATVKVWSYEKESMVDSGLQFCGLIMGDHSKAGINTMFNTGTVVGVGCNVFGGGFPDTFIPSFSWGGPQQKWTEYDFDKMIDTARTVMARRNQTMSSSQVEAFRHIYEQTHRNRKRFFLL